MPIYRTNPQVSNPHKHKKNNKQEISKQNLIGEILNNQIGLQANYKHQLDLKALITSGVNYI